MTTSGRVLFDTCTLENFAVVARLDLLEVCYSGRCGWTTAVEWEIRRGAAQRPHLRLLQGVTWLGDPIDSDDNDTLQQIDRVRRALGGAPTRPFEHLGEAQMLHHVQHVEVSASIATDDRAAYDMALRRGLQVIDTPEILRTCYERQLLSCPEAFELLTKMAQAGRGVAVPDNHWHICPPDP
ncbi:hypothetical protein JQS43_01895 [Natronosporangium hydrolyticum]|uniref:Uncharacterized protein n=1 Tax=Natronosporangium hydrolyticum TaxID=2811111 RepID=A0A895YCE3_9ACTN|nr:hypothetical protein [Natronosporangium hydrolyticum]QSB15151.1 hypothetical protein JQS43_01895 [Natronosporangium hydrolyticum]